MPLYNLRTNPDKGLPFIITKFDDNLDVESSYPVGQSICECPAGHRPSCRHRLMLPTLKSRVDTAWFWDFEASAWSDPTGEANKPAAEDKSEIVDEDEVGPSDNPYSDADEPLAPKADSHPITEAQHVDDWRYAATCAEVEFTQDAALAPKPAATFKRRL